MNRKALTPEEVASLVKRGLMQFPKEEPIPPRMTYAEYHRHYSKEWREAHKQPPVI